MHDLSLLIKAPFHVQTGYKWWVAGDWSAFDGEIIKWAPTPFESGWYQFIE